MKLNFRRGSAFASQKAKLKIGYPYRVIRRSFFDIAVEYTSPDVESVYGVSKILVNKLYE